MVRHAAARITHDLRAQRWRSVQVRRFSVAGRAERLMRLILLADIRAIIAWQVSKTIVRHSGEGP